MKDLAVQGLPKRSTVYKSEKVVFLKFDTFSRPVLESVKADAQVWRNYGNATKKFIYKRYSHVCNIDQLRFEFKVFHLLKQFKNYYISKVQLFC